jgi:hypothetical protein
VGDPVTRLLKSSFLFGHTFSPTCEPPAWFERTFFEVTKERGSHYRGYRNGRPPGLRLL